MQICCVNCPFYLLVAYLLYTTSILVHVMFTGLYTCDYEFNNMDDVNVLFR